MPRRRRKSAPRKRALSNDIKALVVVFLGLQAMLYFGYKQYDPLIDSATGVVGVLLARIAKGGFEDGEA